MMMLRNKADCIRWITFTLYLMVLFCGGEVEAIDKKYKAKQKRKRSNRGKKTSEDINLSYGFWIMGFLLCSVTVPTIAYFVYSVLQDPITPSVMKDAWDVAKLRYFGYISSLSKKTGGGDGSSSDRGGRDKQIFDRAMNSRRTGSETMAASGSVTISDDEVDVEDFGAKSGNVLHKD